MKNGVVVVERASCYNSADLFQPSGYGDTTWRATSFRYEACPKPMQVHSQLVREIDM